jgi:hypothetical protein
MKLPTIVVVGCLPAQARKVAQECRGLARLRFVEVTAKRFKLPPADELVLWIRFLGHNYTEEAFNRWPRSRVHLHKGGLKQLVNVVRTVAIASISKTI